MDTTYVISLDALDLSLLPTTYHPRRNLTPVWNSNNELSEFTIHIKNSTSEPFEPCVTEESKLKTQEIESIVCHMCKADVPKQFFKEHKKSPKHKIYTNIANIALQRIKEHINDEFDGDEKKGDDSTYFCSHCVAVVKIDERKSHENSQSHKNSVVLDKCLSDFLVLYTVFDETDNDDKKSNIIDSTSSNKKIENKKFNVKSYLEMLKDKYKMSMKLKVIDEDRLEIEVDSTRVDVATQNFLGLKTESSDSLNCVICKEIIKIEDKVEHIMSAKHMNKVSIPFKDVHCKREIQSDWHHCVLCNVITDISNLHTISDPNHHRLLQKALKCKIYDNSTANSTSSESWTIVTNKTNKTNSITNKESVLNRYSDLLDTENNSISSKDDILLSAKKTFCSNCNVYIVTKNLKKHMFTNKHIGNGISKFYYLFKSDLDITSCRICDVVVNLIDDFEKHVSLSEHVEKYNVLLATNKISKIDNNQFYCSACDQVVLVKNELCHIKDSGHIKHLDLNKDTSPICDYHCNVCDTYVTNTVKDIQLHNESISHWLKKSSVTSDNVSTVKNYFYDYTMLETRLQSLVNCSVCDTFVPKDEKLIKIHIEGDDHTGMYKKLLQDHHLVLQNNNIYCNVCKVLVGVKSEIMHVKGKKHLKYLQNAEKMSNISSSVENLAKTEAGLRVNVSGVDMNESELLKILEDFDITENMKELICKTCKVTVPFTTYNSRGHVEGSKHKQKLMDIVVVKCESTSASNT